MTNRPPKLKSRDGGRRSEILKHLLRTYKLQETPEGLKCDGHLIAALFNVEGEAVDAHGNVLGVAISRDIAGEARLVLVPMSALRKRHLLATCLEQLSMMTPVEDSHLKAIAHYIRELATLRRVLTPEREGFHRYQTKSGATYTVAVVGSTVFGTAPLPVVPCISIASKYASRGALDAWKSDFAALLPGNPMLVYAICFGLSAAVANFCRLPRPNAMFCGESSTGKSTMAKLIQSTYGPPCEPHQWASTNNGLEALASLHQDLPLVIDELGSGESASVLTALYRLTGEVGKARATPAGVLGEVATLTSPVFATGELSIWQQAVASGGVPRAGHEVRLPCIPVAEPFGVYTRVSPQCQDGAAFSKLVQKAMERNYGVLFPELLQGLIDNENKWLDAAARYIPSITKRLRPSNPQRRLTGVEERVLTQFATVAFAGGIAVHLKLLPISQTEVWNAIQHIFALWQAMWSDERREPRLAALQHVKGWVKLKSEGQLLPLKDWKGHGRANVVGYIKMRNDEKVFLIHAEFFHADLCAHHSVKVTITALREAGMLVHNRNTNLLYVRMPRSEDAGTNDSNKIGFYAIREKLLYDQQPEA